MQVIRCGVTRTVLLTRRYAVKVPTLRGIGFDPRSLRGRLAGFARGVLANHSEYVWHSYGPWQGLVAPVLRSWLGGIVQVYPRCKPLPVGYWGPLPVLEPCPGDMKAVNFGVLDGRIVRLDYDMSTQLPSTSEPPIGFV